MSSPILQHPDEADLMRFLDGELPERDALAIRRHAEACWQCRRDLNEMQTTIDAYLRLRDAEVLPPPPREWKELPLPDSDPRRRVWPIWRMALASAVVAAAIFYLRPAAPVVQQAPKMPPPIEAKARVVTPKPAPEKTAEPPARVTEAQILAALHRVGADLGEPVEVIVEKDGIRVRATALDPARAAAIREAVAGARFELVEPKLVGSAPGEVTPVVPRPVVFGVNDELANAVIDESDAITARAHALGALAARFKGAKLPATDAALVRDMEEDHTQALRQHVAQLRKLVATLPTAAAPARDAEPLSELARELDELVSAGFAGAASPLSDADLVSRLQRVLRELAR